jgi:hypothetical protein
VSYTPGPWHIALPGGPQGPFYGLVNSQGNVVATQIVGEANARLIAVAPELLELVNFVLACEGNDYAVDDQWVERAEAAIAKAEGREP